MCNNKKHCSFANHCGFDDSWRLQKLKNDKLRVQRSVNMCRSELFSDSANLILVSRESHCDTATSATAPRWPPGHHHDRLILQTSKLIVTSYFCAGYMFWWPPATGATSLHPSPRLLSLPPESSESSWLSSESNLSWIVVKSLHYAAMDRLSPCPRPWAGVCWPVCGHECWLRYCHRKVRKKIDANYIYLRVSFQTNISEQFCNHRPGDWRIVHSGSDTWVSSHSDLLIYLSTRTKNYLYL